jgi:Flp pilus assembly protein TadG
VEGDSVRARINRRHDRGAAAVEFGLVLIPFLLIVFGIIQYGFLFYSYQGGSDVAREAARRAAVSDLVPCTNAAKTGFVDVTRANVGSLKDATDTPVVQRVYDIAAGDGDDTVLDVGDTVKVTVSFKSHNLHLPFVPVPNDARVTTHATSRVEIVPNPAPVDCP